MNRTALPWLFLFFTLSGLSAQTRHVAFRTLCVEYVDDLKKVIIPGKNPEASQEIRLWKGFSEFHDGYFKSNFVEFFKLVLGEDGTEVRELVAKAPLAKKNRQFFVIYPNPKKGKEGLPYSVMCLNDDFKTFPMGHVRVINLSPVPVRFKVAGELSPVLKSLKFFNFPHPSKTNEHNMYPAVTEFYSPKLEAWLVGQSVSWKATNKNRKLAITILEPRTKNASVRLYADRYSLEDAAEERKERKEDHEGS